MSRIIRMAHKNTSQNWCSVRWNSSALQTKQTPRTDGASVPTAMTARQETRSAEKTKKTVAQIDEDMRRAMEDRAGEGGAHGAVIEEGKEVAMARAVKENMFRYI